MAEVPFEVRPLLKATDRYDRPAGSEANRCGCSWAAYNLISACTACQGNPQSIRLWPDFIQSCPPEALSDSSFYFPDAISGLNDDVSIPAWATTDPRQWIGQTWNIQQARSIYNDGLPDVTKTSVLAERSRASTPTSITPTSSTPTSSTPTSSTPANSTPTSSTPAGAIAGGVIGSLVIIAAFPAYFFLKRHRAKLAPGPPAHSRQTLAGTLHSREEMITPFTVHRPSETSTPRKGSSVNIPSYDSLNALPPPVRGEDVGLDGTPPRWRVNPPTYSAIFSASPPPAAHQGAGRHGANGFYAAVGHSANNSFSDVYTSHPMDAASASGVPEGTTVSSSELPLSWPRDVKQRPADDIA
ncbi:hypothetical protein FA15DRAFT_757009 [Coprinopsis marcescibilis]|uniref:Uncharacterized protein n=1 Tax=Coprinopsis marcescibilis TaxID=230819 RepID=A0A5C3KTU9_COPMA|nr:hypothetical protein FA15DRAFT_757009 [Coprinopsis marcescibilis]